MNRTRALPSSRPSRLLSSLLLVSAVALAGCSKSDKPTPTTAAPAAPGAATPAAPKPPAGPSFAVIETDKGTIEFELLANDAPKAVENFKLLSERGYYNGVTFHRIVKNFMIQGGDPLGTGAGGKSAWGGFFDDEIQKDSPLYQKGLGYKRGIVAMANMGRNTNGSQFFILHKDYPLAPSYVIFGRVTKGMEVVDALAEVPVTRGLDGGMSKPTTPPVMKKVTVRQ
jgi:cyclophilin family peptidyl-prolyl cis-trans isomerase